jgi:hypothetical protein
MTGAHHLREARGAARFLTRGGVAIAAGSLG